MSIKKVYLIRHGQTDYNLQSIVQGSGVNSSLNAEGQRQASLFFDKYKAVAFDKVYTSTLQRSIQSVQKFLDLGLPHEQHAGLNEINWGTREGTRITPEEDAYYYNMLETWTKGGTDQPIEGGESPQMVSDRQRVFVDLMLSRPEEETILVCMHGRAMRILLCQLLRYPLRCMDNFRHENLCLYELDYTGSMFSVRKYCDVAHLQPEMVL
ncbi:histidine phosphatase family protein [Pontibacter akesuensis]|uniref:Probable phosphoglycerate mutase n=1 Tax=Pontibacter akesuensis TaxID=388950 RepID=A0A1I7GQN1_9BACT|nr:histidine phosphatase family protein [Pontibacter akesuensis]GHA55574.1 phosphoglycerate mutase [Pontibacter akesuensis]SFU50709.1 probable phosphoglycerate mutase [Pontibacter akesuensis]